MMIAKCSRRSSGTVRHIPQRTCIACRQVKSKVDLIRIVNSPDEGITIDSTCKKPGRGAYICKKKECWNSGLKGNQLERALHTSLSSKERDRLNEYKENLLRE